MCQKIEHDSPNSQLWHFVAVCKNLVCVHIQYIKYRKHNALFKLNVKEYRNDRIPTMHFDMEYFDLIVHHYGFSGLNKQTAGSAPESNRYHYQQFYSLLLSKI